MKTWIVTGILILSMGIMGGYSWTAASAAQRQLPARNAAYCVQHGAGSLACVLNGAA